jgi:uncharacterized protein YecT (DUF1311 family)
MRARLAWFSVIVLELAATCAFAVTPLEECYDENADRQQIRACLDARVKAAEDALADAYRAMRSDMERIDRAVGRPVAERSFEAAQRAFRDYRDKHCAWIVTKAMGASDAGDLKRDCRIRLAQQRTRELEEPMPEPGARR